MDDMALLPLCIKTQTQPREMALALIGIGLDNKR